MTEVANSIAELEDMLQSVSAANRPKLLKHVVDLLLQNADRLLPAHVQMFDVVINSLMTDIEVGALAEMSKHLSACGKVPISVAMRLASDQGIAVAEPMLLESPCLDDAFLIDMVKTSGQMHILAIACRSQVSEPVTKAIVEKGDDVVVRYVVNNPGAAFSEASLFALVERSKGDAALAEQLKHRDDIRRLPVQVQAAR